MIYITKHKKKNNVFNSTYFLSNSIDLFLIGGSGTNTMRGNRFQRAGIAHPLNTSFSVKTDSGLFQLDKAKNFCTKQKPIVDFDPDKINSTDNYWKMCDKCGLHLIHSNKDRILSKTDELHLIARTSKAILIGMTESKLNKSV